MAAEALLALAAEPREAGDDVVAGLHVGDTGADRLHDAGALVAEHQRAPSADHQALGDVEVAVADAGGHRPHQHLPVAGRVEGDGLDGERLVRLPEHGGPDVHGPSS